MNSESEELFQSILLDHDARPRHFFQLDDATHVESGVNPVCGDRFTVYLQVDDEIIAGASFDGRGCTLSKASASMMVSMLPGMTIAGACAIRDALRDSLIPGEPVSDDISGDLEALLGVREHPSRIACVMLAWDAMVRAIRPRHDSSSPRFRR